MITVKVSHTDDFPEEIVGLGETVLPAPMVGEIGKYKFFQDRKSRVLARLLLLESILETGHDAALLHAFERDANRKPFIKNWLEFNISHSGKMVIVACSAQPLGVDVEKIQAVEMDLFKNHLHPEEWASIHAAPDPLRPFFDIWSRKEAILKADGVGIVYDLRRLNSLAEKIELHDNAYTLLPLTVPENYTGYLAFPATGATVEIVQQRIRRLQHLGTVGQTG